MPWVEKKQAVIGFKVWKRIGRPMLCGYAWCGWSQCGEEIEWCGVYQQRRHRKGYWYTGEIQMGGPRNFFMAPTWPTNEYHENRQLWRGTFADAVQAWQSLTDEEREAYNIKAIKKSRHGYNYFLSQYLKSQ